MDLSLDETLWAFKLLTLNYIDSSIAEIKSRKKSLKEESRRASGSGSGGSEAEEEIIIGQLNCNRSQRALLHAFEWKKRSNSTRPLFDILLLSEPPVNINGASIKCGFPGSKVFHYEGLNQEAQSFWSAIIVLNPGLPIKFKSAWANPFIVTIIVPLGPNREIKISSIYNHTEKPEAEKEIIRLLNFRAGMSLVGGDFNTHIKEWNRSELKTSLKQNVKQKDLISEMKNGPWLIMNKPGQPTWKKLKDEESESFKESTIDYSLISEDIAHWTHNWKILSWPEGSDHCLISMNMRTGGKVTSRDSFPPSNFKIAKNLSKTMSSISNFDSLVKHIDEAKANTPSFPPAMFRGKPETRCSIARVRKELRLWEVKRRKGVDLKKAKWKTAKLKRDLIALTERRNKEKGEEIEKTLMVQMKKNPWKFVPIGKGTSSNLCTIKKGGEEISDRTEMAKAIMDTLHEKQPTSPQPWSFEDWEESPKDPALSFGEFIWAVNSLKNNKASGVDGCSVKLVKILVDKYPAEIHGLYKKIFDSTHIPRSWKRTKMVVLAKKKTRCPDVNSIRAIGISTAWAKIFEIICLNRLVYWAKLTNALLPSQSGFIKGIGTLDALEPIMETLRKRNREGKLTRKLITKIDVKGAFDNVRPKDILDALVNHGFPRELITLIKEYIMSRTNFLDMNEVMIFKKKLMGTVQGAIFSPFLFNMVLASALRTLPRKLGNIEKKWKVNITLHIYADDIIIITESLEGYNPWSEDGLRMIRAIEEGLVELGTRLNRINLELSEEKSSHMFWPNDTYTVQAKRKEIPNPKLNVTRKQKLLGITLDSVFSGCHLRSHIEEKVQEGRRNLASLKSTKGLSKERRNLMVKSVILKSITYGAHLWFPMVNEKTMRKLEKFYNECLRYVLKADRYTQREVMLVLAGWLPVRCLLWKEVIAKSLKDHGLEVDGHYLPPAPKKSTYTIFDPANFPEFEYLGECMDEAGVPVRKEGEIHLYTDASLTKESGGMAIVNVEDSRSRLFRVPPCFSSFELEAKAILLALSNIPSLTHNNPQKVFIFTDSKSVVSALRNRSNDHYIIQDIRTQLWSQRNQRTFALAWVKAHSGIPGNFLADFMASTATTCGTWTTLAASTRTIKREAERRAWLLWTKEYERMEENSFKKFYPTLEVADAFAKENPSITDITSTHADFLREYALRARAWGKYKPDTDPGFDSPFCECNGKATQDGWHMVFECALLKEERKKVMEEIGMENTSEMNFNTMARNKKFYHMVNKIAPLVEGKLKQVREEKSRKPQ